MVAARVHCERNELGAETVQLAFTMPLLLIVIMAFVQLCMMAFSMLTLSSEVEQAAWYVDLEKLANAADDEANSLVEEAIIACSSTVDRDSLEVSGAAFTQQDSYSHRTTTAIINNPIVSDEEEHRYQLGELYRETSAGLVEFDVSYELPSIIKLPGLSHMRISKHVVRERAISTRTEVR